MIPRAFPREEEERLHALGLMRDWRRSGLIGAEDLAAFEKESGEPLRCAGLTVRGLFFALALVGVGAVNVLIAELVDGQQLQGAWIALAGLVFWLAAEFLIARSRLYRFGVEEGLLASAACKVPIGIVLALGLLIIGHSPRVIALSFALPLCASFLLLYLRVGYLYAALAALACAGFAAFNLGLELEPARVLWSAACLLLCAAAGLRHPPEHEREAWEFLQAVLALSSYLTLNLRLSRIVSFAHAAPAASSAFEWATFAFVLLFPPLLIAWALRRRSRALLIAGALTLLLTIVTLKPYLGLERRVWDAATLGAFLMGVGVVLKRWLDAGPGGERGGWTARPLIIAPDEGVGAAGFVAAAAAGVAQGAASAPPSDPKGFGGGSSGGGGASAGF